MSSDRPTKHILIIGAGVAGPAFALFLHKASTHPLSIRDFTCSIYEAYPPTEKLYVGGGLGLAPNGVSVLASLGLDEEIHRRAGVSKSSNFYTEAGTRLISWSQKKEVPVTQLRKQMLEESNCLARRSG